MATAPILRRVDVEELPAHLATLEQELSEAGTIELVRGETVVAEVRAKHVEQSYARNGERYMPDFRGQMRAIFGDRVLDTDGAAIIREDRDARG